MPRKQQSVDMYGQKWKIIDTANLEQAVELLKKVEYYRNNFADSLSGSAQIEKQIVDLAEATDKLRKLNINPEKISSAQLQKVTSALRLLRQTNEELNETTDNISKIINEANNLNKSNTKSFSLNNLADNIVGNAQRQQAQKLYDKYYNEYRSKNKSWSTSKVENQAMAAAASDMAKSANKYTFASNMIQTAANTFKQAASTLWNLFAGGASKQLNVYESTFTNIAARTGTSRSGYYSSWMGLNNELGSRGLSNNVASSDVMQMWDTLASQGMNINLDTEQGRADAYARAIEAVVTKTIVPYLDSSDVYFQQLADMQPQLINQVRGIGITTNEISGSSVIVNRYLNDMIQQLSPVSRLASQDLGIQYAKSLGIYESLRNQNMSDYTIGQLYGLTESVVTDPYAALTNGDPLKSKTVLDVMQNGDLRNSGDVTEGVVLNSGFFASMFPEGRNSSLWIGAGVHNSGMSISPAAMTELANGNFDMIKAITDGNEIADKTEQNGQEQAQKLADDQMQTNSKLQELTMENISNEFATLQGFMGHWYDVIVTAIKGVAGAIAASVVGKGIGALAGSAAGAGGTGAGILASTGGIALTTIGGVAAVTAIGSAIADAMWSSSGEHGLSKAEDDLQGTSLEGNSAATTMLATTNAYEDSNWFQKTFGNVGSGISMLASNIFQGTSDKNKNYLQWAIQSGALDTGDQATNNGYFITLAAMYAQNGYLDSFNKGLQEAGIPSSIDSKEDIGELIKETGITKQTINAYAAQLIDKGWGKINLGDGKSLESFDIDGSQFGLTGVLGYRQGLNEVPYDDYPAILHEGEAVLTASTANELRNLIDEYRTTTNQSINFETIIQNQTASLINKLEQIRQTMEGTYTKENTSVNESNGAASKLNFQSMINMRNTKSAFDK